MLRAIIIAAVMLALAGCWLYAQQHAAAARQELARSWGSPSADFAAVGLRGQNLAVFLPDNDNVECDAFLDSVRTDKHLADELRAAGFREISCGQRKVGL
jgi:hypothetical protein